MFVAGRLYRDPLSAWAGDRAIVPMRGLGIGQQKAWLVQNRIASQRLTGSVPEDYMSRFDVTMTNEGHVRDDAAIGYDGPLRTFLQGFSKQESDFDEPEIWLGTCIEEFPTLEALIEEARARGYEVRGLKAGAYHHHAGQGRAQTRAVDLGASWPRLLSMLVRKLDFSDFSV